MSQNSLVVANGTGAAVRSALNSALNTLVTMNSGSSEPSVMYAYMFWPDTANDLMKIRNAANSAWITVGKLSQTNLGLSAIPRGQLWGMTLSNNGTDATNDIDVAAGSCASDDATDANRVLLNPGALTKQLDVAWAAGNAAGGRISSESLVNGTWHVYAFRRSGGTDDICFSQSLTPTLPDSGTNKRRIGSILRESAAIVGFVQDGDRFMRKSPVQDVDATGPGSAAVTRTLSVPTGIQVWAWVVALGIKSTQDFKIYLSDLSMTDLAPSTTAAPLGNAGGQPNGGVVSLLSVRTNTAGQIRSRVTPETGAEILRIALYGWDDTRGRVN